MSLPGGQGPASAASAEIHCAAVLRARETARELDVTYQTHPLNTDTGAGNPEKQDHVESTLAGTAAMS